MVEVRPFSRRRPFAAWLLSPAFARRVKPPLNDYS